MAVFGEIIEPSSRALLEDPFDDVGSDIELQWQKKYDCPHDVNLFLLLEGAFAVNFAKSCLIDSKQVDEIPNTTVKIYLLQKANIVICTSLSEDFSKIGEITELLRPWLDKSTDVICLQSLSIISYQNSNSSNDSCTVRSLHTKNSKVTPEKLLEQPNILSGLSAGVLSFCEFYEQSASVFAVYSDTPIFIMDSKNTQPFLDLCKKLKVPTLGMFAKNTTVCSNLYM